MKNREISFFLIVIFFLVLVLPSPLLYAMGLRVRWGSFIIACTYIIATIFFQKKTHNVNFLLFLIFSTVGLGIITALYYFNPSYIVILSALIGYSLFYSLLTEKDLHYFITIASKFLLILEIGAIIGFIYSFLGGEPIWKIFNPDTRVNHWYLTTFTNARIGSFIRPAGIYDEPGAFSFFICAVCALRLHYKFSPLMTFMMMFLGIVTTSLTHVICFLLFLIPILKQSNRIQLRVIIFVFVLMVLVALICFYDAFDTLLFQRFEFDGAKNTLKGNSRAGQMENCLKSIRENGFLFGNYSLGADEIRRRYGAISENPLSCLALNGLFNSILYYLFLIFTLFAFIVSLKIDYLVIFLLFLQRPYQSQLGYSFFFVHYLYRSLIELKDYLKRFYICNYERRVL